MKDNFTLLIADDDAEDVEIFLRALEDIKYKIEYVIAKDGIEVLKQLNEQAISPDMIFLDMNMPKIGGLECLTKLRQEEALQMV
jgi:CheY-like chemotaxis protein